MLPLALSAGLLALGAGPSWPRVVEDLRPGAAPPAVAVRGAKRVRVDAPRGLVRGLVDTGLLAAWNRVGATPRDASGALDLDRVREVALARDAFASWAVVLDARGHVTAAFVRVPVPVDTSADPRGGFSSRRLRRLRDALAVLRRHHVRATQRDARGNAFGWAGRTDAARFDARYEPARDLLTILVYAP